MGRIISGPHYQLSTSELAKWLEQQKPESWWTVDGDPLLTGRLAFPCPADELATELRRIKRELLVQAPADDTTAKGQPIDSNKLQFLWKPLATAIRTTGTLPEFAMDRFFDLCWKESPKNEWLLAEDTDTADHFREETDPKE